MLDAVLEKQRATALCTIYYPAYDDPDMQRVSVAALAFFNDCIIRAAASNGLPLLDLRLVCNERADYANEIEPSDVGGWKIAQGITRVLFEHDFSERRSTIFVWWTTRPATRRPGATCPALNSRGCPAAGTPTPPLCGGLSGNTNSNFQCPSRVSFSAGCFAIGESLGGAVRTVALHRLEDR